MNGRKIVKRPVDVRPTSPASEAASEAERKPRRRKPDAMARAQADVDDKAAAEFAHRVEEAAHEPDAFDAIATSEGADPIGAELDATQALDTQCFASSVEASVPPAGPLVEMPSAPPSRAIQMTDLKPHERSALAGYASTFHRADAQIEAFESGESVGHKGERVRMGTRRLVELGLVEERTLYLVTELGAHVAKSGGIEVTRAVAKAAAEAAS